MNDIKTFSLVRHSQMFAVPPGITNYLFVQAIDHPYKEEPYRSESYALAYLKRGSIGLQTGTDMRTVDAPAIIALAPSVIRSFHKVSQQMQVDVLFFDAPFLLEKSTDRLFLVNQPMFEHEDYHVVLLSGVLLTKIGLLYELIALAHAVHNKYTHNIIRSYIFALIFEIGGAIASDGVEEKPKNSAAAIFAGFRHLVSQNYMSERKLDFYASELNVSRKYLSTIIKKYSGKSAGKWIDEVVILEAKVCLQDPTATVLQISDKLNFPDQSTFGKFFKSSTGLSPLEYRKKN